MAKKVNKKTGKWVIYGIVGALVLYIIYLMTKGKARIPEGCFVFEETHPASGDSDWVCMHPDSRPPSGQTPFQVGGNVTVSNTTESLDGTYEILDIWVDESGRQGCMRVNHDYDYVYTATQGGSPRDVTFFGTGVICPN